MSVKPNSLTKEQFVKAIWNHCIAHNTFMWNDASINIEWERFQKGRSWCNEFFSTKEGAKYVE